MLNASPQKKHLVGIHQSNYFPGLIILEYYFETLTWERKQSVKLMTAGLADIQYAYASSNHILIKFWEKNFKKVFAI